MLRVGRFLLIISACLGLWGAYHITPGLLRSQSQAINFLRVVGVGGGVCVLLIGIFSAVAVPGKRSAPSAPRPRAGASVPPSQYEVGIEIDHMGRQVKAALAKDYNPTDIPDAHRRIDNLADAMSTMVAMLKRNQPQ